METMYCDNINSGGDNSTDVRVATIIESAFTMAVNGYYVSPLSLNESVVLQDDSDGFYSSIVESTDCLIESLMLLEGGAKDKDKITSTPSPSKAENTQTFTQKVKKFFNDLWENIKNIATKIKDKVVSAFETVRGWITGLINTIRTFITRVFNWIANKFSGKDVSNEDKSAAKNAVENSSKLLNGASNIVNESLAKTSNPEDKKDLQELKQEIDDSKKEVQVVQISINNPSTPNEEVVAKAGEGAKIVENQKIATVTKVGAKRADSYRNEARATGKNVPDKKGRYHKQDKNKNKKERKNR